MKSNRFCRTISMLLVVMMVFGIAGCAKEEEKTVVVIEPMEKEEVLTYSFDMIGGTDVMPLVGYYGPNTDQFGINGIMSPDMLTADMFELIKGVGINMISYVNMQYQKQDAKRNIFTILELAEKHGMGFFVEDERWRNATNQDPKVAQQMISEMISEYAHYSSFAGIHMPDELGHATLLDTDAWHPGKRIDQVDYAFLAIKELGYFANGNLYPMTTMGSDREKWTKYIRDYIEACQPEVLAYDYYMFNENGVNTDMFFAHLAIAREESEKAGIPFWGYIQNGYYFNDQGQRADTIPDFPNRGQYLWNVGCTLAYGAKVMQFFTLNCPGWYAYTTDGSMDPQRGGFIGPYGSKTRWYQYGKEILAQIAAVDEVLMNSVHKGVIATNDDIKTDLGTTNYLIKGTSWRELKGVKGDALIGCFNYNGKTALYVVNYDMEYAQHITLDFVNKYDVTVTQSAKESHHTGDSLTLTLSAGNSALVVFE